MPTLINAIFSHHRVRRSLQPQRLCPESRNFAANCPSESISVWEQITVATPPRRSNCIEMQTHDFSFQGAGVCDDRADSETLFRSGRQTFAKVTIVSERSGASFAEAIASMMLSPPPPRQPTSL